MQMAYQSFASRKYRVPQVDYSKFAQRGPAPNDARIQKDADFWRTIGAVAPAVGTGLGTAAGGLLGTFALPGLGTAAGASIGGALGGAAGAGVGGLATYQGESQLDPLRRRALENQEREMRRMALMQAIGQL